MSTSAAKAKKPTMSPIDDGDLAAYRKSFDADVRFKIAQNAVSETPLDKIALDRSVVTGIDRSMSHQLDDHKVSNQKKSGRCWLFAGLNVLRVHTAQTLNVKDFEFSQNWMLFWDKLEKANYFLESIMATADRDVDDRTVNHLLGDPINDGGQWNMFVAIIGKYGVVPKMAMPETESSSNTRFLNQSLETLLRQGARDLRALHSGTASKRAARKDEILAGVYRVLTIHLGTPPEKFLWQWNDKDRQFHRDGEMTPLEFAERYINVNLDEYVCLVNDPRESSPVGRTFTVDFLGNVADAPPVTYLNVDIDTLRTAAKDSIVDGEPVWFGCDTGKQSNGELGYWDAALYDYGSVYDVDFDLNKADRLVHRDSLMTHAMVLTGVDVLDDSPRRWRVENSWGGEKADEGFWTMNDSWFGEHVFEIAVHKSRLSKDLQKALGSDPIVLPAWDPMGALACEG